MSELKPASAPFYKALCLLLFTCMYSLGGTVKENKVVLYT